MTKHLTVVHTSSIRKKRRCDRLYYLSEILGYEPLRVNRNFTFGRLWHLAQDAWWGSLLDTPKSRMGNVVQVLHAHEADPMTVAKASAMMTGYEAKWGHCTEATLVGTEHRFEVPLDDGIVLRGAADKIIQRNQDLWIGEHKTTSEDISPGSNYWKRLWIDAQVSNYYNALQDEGIDVVGVFYDVVRKPMHKPKQDPAEYYNRLVDAISEKPDYYYGRAEVRRMEHEASEARNDLYQTAKEIHDRPKEIQHWPRNSDACVYFGSTCEFFGVCTGTESLNDQYLFERKQNV